MDPGKANDNSTQTKTLSGVIVVTFFFFVLAAFLLPVPPERPSQRTLNRLRARTEMSALVAAIQAYHADYGRWPISDAEQAAAGTNDFTTGLTFGPGPHSLDSNSNVIAILMDWQTFGNGAKTVNFGHALNQRQIRYLNAKLSGTTLASGVGPDGVYRDPWGDPYIITMDLNHDGICSDLLYSQAGMARNQYLKNTLSGGKIVVYSDTNGVGGDPLLHGQVMVWSAGPDRSYDPGPANAGANLDNILIWQ